LEKVPTLPTIRLGMRFFLLRVRRLFEQVRQSAAS
jgi:hypothetical protein